MSESQEKKINHESFETAVSKLRQLKDMLDSKKSQLEKVNNELTNEENWKGVSRDYYNEITIEQKKKFGEMNDALKKFISDLEDISTNFDNLDKSISEKYEQ